MDIVIISNFCMDFSKTDNDRFLYIANMLSDAHEVEIVTSDFFHTKKMHRSEPLYNWPIKITFLHEIGYKKNVCVKRFYSHYVWGRNVKNYLQNRKKPDVVYCAVPSLSGAYYTAKYCEKNKIRFMIDVQDLWPEAFQMIFRIPVVSKILFWPLKEIANGIYRRADQVIAVSQTYLKRAMSVNSKCQKGNVVYLGTELKTFEANISAQTVLEKENDDIWLGYCGTLGKSYDIKCVIDALSILHHPHLKFIVMGDGPLKSEFEKYAQEKNIKVSFVGRLPYDKMCAMLVKCDMVVNPIIGLSVASIINKHADYAAAGCPVLNTQNSVEYRTLIEKFNMGYSVEPGDYKTLAEQMKYIIENKKIRSQMGMNARKCAEECFDRKNTYKRIINEIDSKE